MKASHSFSILVLFIFSLSISCTEIFSSPEVNSALRSELNDRGKIKLDPTNPYVAPNAFLAEEAKISENLKGFLSMKGNPTAISYHETYFSAPELSLYYEDKGELYLLKQKGSSWIIASPTKTEAIEQKINSDSSSLFRKEPPVVTYMDPKLEEARKKASEQQKIPEKHEDTTKEVPNKTPPTESNDFTDSYHIVEFPGQTLEFVSFWYTGSIDALDRIAGINGIDRKVPLRLSQSIRIPSYLAIKKDKPTEQDFLSFQASR